MKTYQGSEIRNVAVVGHAHSGKSTLIAALLHAAKMTPTQGRVEDGSAVTAYDEEEVRGEKRVLLRLDRRLAPYKVAVLPLSRNERLSPLGREVAALLRPHYQIDFDDASSIGRRYRRQDEIGTPFCVTVDFDSLDDRAVTVRERDTMTQERIPLDALLGYLGDQFQP